MQKWSWVWYLEELQIVPEKYIKMPNSVFLETSNYKGSRQFGLFHFSHQSTP